MGRGAGQPGEGLIAGGLRSLDSASPLESLVLTPLEILKLGFQFNYILIKWNKGTGAPGSRLSECLMEFQSCFLPASYSPRGLEPSLLRRPGSTWALRASQPLPWTEGQQVPWAQLSPPATHHPQTLGSPREILPKVTPKVRGRSGT